MKPIRKAVFPVAGLGTRILPATKSMPLDPASRRRERNRLAAERCRQRKTGLIETLQKECDELRRQKDQLLKENERLLRALGLKF